MKKTIITKFKKFYKSKIAPKLKQRHKFDLEIDKLDSKIDNLNLKNDKIDEEIEWSEDLDAPAFYHCRITQVDGHLAVATPVWVG